MLDFPPLPAQRIMTDFLLNGDSRLLFAAPGTGKSRSAINSTDWLMGDMAVRGTLVLAPKRVARLAWPDELGKWSRSTYADLSTERGQQAWVRGTADYYLLNYDRVKPFAEKFLQTKKRLLVNQIIMDECHRTRNSTGVHARKLVAVRGKFDRVVAMTGTPTPNSPLDLFNQARLADGGTALGPSWTAFRERYATSDWMGYNWTLNPGAEEEIYRRISHMTLVMKAEEWLDIPPVSIEDIEIPMPAELKTGYKKLQKEMLLQLEKGEIVAQSAGVLVGKLRQYTSGAVYHEDENQKRGVLHVHDAKIEALISLQKKMAGSPLLVFIHYEHERERILKAIPEARVFDERDLGKWNAGGINMWIAHPASVGEGLNLQKPCSNVCWFSGSYSAADFAQSNARVARTGQTKPVRIFRLVVRDSIDEGMAEVVRRKLNGQNAALETLKAMAVLMETT